MQALLERVWHDQGFTAILVTHDVAEAVALADRVLVIEDGRIGLDLRVDVPRPRLGATPTRRPRRAHPRPLFRDGAPPKAQRAP